MTQQKPFQIKQKPETKPSKFDELPAATKSIDDKLDEVISLLQQILQELKRSKEE